MTSSSRFRAARAAARAASARETAGASPRASTGRVQGLGLGDALAVARLGRRSAATSSNPSSRTNAASRTARRCGGGTLSARSGDGAGAVRLRPRPGRAAGRPQRSGAPSRRRRPAAWRPGAALQFLEQAPVAQPVRDLLGRALLVPRVLRRTRGSAPRAARGTRNDVRARARPEPAAAGRPGAASPWRPGTSSRRPWAAVAVWALAVGRLCRPARSQGTRSKQQPKPSVACAGRQRCDFFAAPPQGSVGSTMWRSFSAAGGPVGSRGMAQLRERGLGQSCMGGLNFRVSLAPFCAVWAREGRLARPATFPGDPGRYGSGALILAAWLSPLQCERARPRGRYQLFRRPFRIALERRHAARLTDTGSLCSRTSVGRLPKWTT